MSSIEFWKEQWDSITNTDRLFESSTIPNNSMVTPDDIAKAAETLGGNSLIMQSYQKFQNGDFKWFFSKNPNLVGKYSNVSSLKTWKGWKTLDTQQKQVICDLAGLNPNTLPENQTTLDKLIEGFKRWPQNLYAIFWGNEYGGVWTCNIFVGEALYWAGKNAVSNGKYYSAAQIHDNKGPFKAVESKNLKRGNIVTFSGSHTEIVTKTPLKFLIADDGFCSIGAGRHNDQGSVKCDSSFSLGTREINNPNNKYHAV
ncbi:MAG: hypothetical protein J5I91_00290 [Bacteroidetes bacterium]|nr:hypothetical protein [Bacteroidota bacterium]